MTCRSGGPYSGAMARSWTRLHEHLGRPPGPLTYDMITEAVHDKLAESDDLDWKERLPNLARTPGVWNEFAKDIAAMANTRGGLLVYGVSDRIELTGIDLGSVDEKQLLSTVRNGVQPFISGVAFLRLRHPDGKGPDVLVVDVPPSATDPHFQYGWEQKDKDRVTFNAPYRINDETFYMTEHQIARAYQERFARQTAADALLQTRLAELTETVLAESKDAAWLVVAAQPVRPAPRLVPAPTRAQAQDVLSQAVKTAGRLKDAFCGQSILANALNNDMQVGLCRWIDSTFLVPERRTDLRGVVVELHHDGTATVSVDLPHGLRRSAGSSITLLNTVVLDNAVVEAVALADAFRSFRTPESPVEVVASVAKDNADDRLAPVRKRYDDMQVIPDTRRPLRLLPASTQLPPQADDAVLRESAHELSTGLLHQFGLTQC